MADGFHPLRHGTIMMFGSLEFMSLGSDYDMILLPPRDDVEPKPEPIPPQSVRGRRSGHHAGGSRRGRQRSRISDPTSEARIRPVLPPHIPHQVARSSGPTGARGRACGASSFAPRANRDYRDRPSHPVRRGGHGPRPSPARGLKGPQRPVHLHSRMEEQQRHLLSYHLGSGMPPSPTPLP